MQTFYGAFYTMMLYYKYGYNTTFISANLKYQIYYKYVFTTAYIVIILENLRFKLKILSDNDAYIYNLLPYVLLATKLIFLLRRIDTLSRKKEAIIRYNDK